MLGNPNYKYLLCINFHFVNLGSSLANDNFQGMILSSSPHSQAAVAATDFVSQFFCVSPDSKDCIGQCQKEALWFEDHTLISRSWMSNQLQSSQLPNHPVHTAPSCHFNKVLRKVYQVPCANLDTPDLYQYPYLPIY